MNGGLWPRPVRYSLCPFLPHLSKPTMCQHYVEDLLGTRHFIRQSYNNLARWTYYHFAEESFYPRSVMTAQPGLPATPQGSSVQTWGAGSVFNLRWFILWNWRSIRNFSGCSIHLSVPLREREMVSIFNLGKLLFFVCEKVSTRQRAGAWRVEGSDKIQVAQLHFNLR